MCLTFAVLWSKMCCLCLLLCISLKWIMEVLVIYIKFFYFFLFSLVFLNWIWLSSLNSADSAWLIEVSIKITPYITLQWVLTLFHFYAWAVRVHKDAHHWPWPRCSFPVFNNNGKEERGKLFNSLCLRLIESSSNVTSDLWSYLNGKMYRALGEFSK